MPRWLSRLNHAVHLFDTTIPHELNHPDAVPQVTFPLLSDFQRLHEVKQSRLRREASEQQPQLGTE